MAGAALLLFNEDDPRVADMAARMLESPTARQHGIDMTPRSPGIAAHIAYVAPLLLVAEDILRAEFDAGTRLTSGYRPPELNALISTAPNSRHIQALAGDFGNAWTLERSCDARDVILSRWPGDLPPVRFIYGEGNHLHMEFFAPGETLQPTRVA